MEDGHNGGLMIVVVVRAGMVSKRRQEFATTRGPKTEVQIAAVLLGKLHVATLEFAVSFSFAYCTLLRQIVLIPTIYIISTNFFPLYIATATPVPTKALRTPTRTFRKPPTTSRKFIGSISDK